jgi:hypothetical protein
MSDMKNWRIYLVLAAILTVVATVVVLRPSAARTAVAEVRPAAAVRNAASPATAPSVPAGTSATTAGVVPTVTTLAPAPVTTTVATTPVHITPPTVARAVPVPASSSPTAVGSAALARVRYPWATLGYQITFHGPKSGFLGLTNCSTRRIDIYVTPGQSVVQVEYVTTFEIAHAIDCLTNTPQRDARWAATRGFTLHGSWYPSCSCSEDAFASGDFADVFALSQVGPIYQWRSSLAPAPDSRQMAALLPMFQV